MEAPSLVGAQLDRCHPMSLLASRLPPQSAFLWGAQGLRHGVGCQEDWGCQTAYQSSTGWAVGIKPQADQAQKTPSSLQGLICLEVSLS